VRLDQKLNFIIPIYNAVTVKDDVGQDQEVEQVVGYIHSTPILNETFERYFLTISKTFAAIYGEGLGYMAAPRVTSILLKRAAQSISDWDGPDGVQQGLLGEINRLSNYVSAGPGGWSAIPLETAIVRKMLSDDDVAEVTNAVAFFIVNSAMQRRTDLRVTLAGAARLWDARVSSSSCTEFVASLKTSTAAESTGATQPAVAEKPPAREELQIPH
jgi:hypothetical protein